MPLGDAIALHCTWPAFTAIAARILLKERLPNYFFVICISCLAGVVFLAQPEFIFNAHADSVDYRGIIWVFIGVFGIMATRLLARKTRDVHVVQVMIISTIQTFVYSPLLWLFCKYVLGAEQEILGATISFGLKYNLLGVLMGCIGFGRLVITIISFHYGEVTKLAWFGYLSLIFAYIFQVAVFKDVPNVWAYIGAVCILIGAALPLIEQTVLYRQEQEVEAESQQYAPVPPDDEMQPLIVET